MKKYWYGSFLFMLGILLDLPAVRGQDPNFSQFFNVPVYFNPAFTGLNTGLRTRFAYRNQWPNLPSSYKSYFFSAEFGERNLPGSGGLGLIVNSDNEGIGFIKNLNVGLNLSVRVPLTRNIVSQMGIRASVVEKRVNWDDFVFTDQLNEKYGNIYTSAFQRPESNKRIFPDFAAGGLFQFSNDAQRFIGSAGIGIDHLFQPDQGFLSTERVILPRKWVFHSDFIILTSEGRYSDNSLRGTEDPLKLNPGIIYQLQDGLSHVQAGLNLLKYNIYLGAWYKAALGTNGSSAMTFVAGYRYLFAEDMGVKFMYSYDLCIAGAALGLGGAHEIILVLEFDKLSLFNNNSYSGMNRGGRGRQYFECSDF